MYVDHVIQTVVTAVSWSPYPPVCYCCILVTLSTCLLVTLPACLLLVYAGHLLLMYVDHLIQMFMTDVC